MVSFVISMGKYAKSEILEIKKTPTECKFLITSVHQRCTPCLILVIKRKIIVIPSSRCRCIPATNPRRAAVAELPIRSAVRAIDNILNNLLDFNVIRKKKNPTMSSQ